MKALAVALGFLVAKNALGLDIAGSHQIWAEAQILNENQRTQMRNIAGWQYSRIPWVYHLGVGTESTLKAPKWFVVGSFTHRITGFWVQGSVDEATRLGISGGWSLIGVQHQSQTWSLVLRLPLSYLALR